MRLSFLDIIDKFKLCGFMEFPNEKTVTSLTGTFCLRTPFLSFFCVWSSLRCNVRTNFPDMTSTRTRQYKYLTLVLVPEEKIFLFNLQSPHTLLEKKHNHTHKLKNVQSIQESILPKFDFFVFQIFIVKLECL
jgi:hypothetical protein